jgi:hypothetical protein
MTRWSACNESKTVSPANQIRGIFQTASFFNSKTSGATSGSNGLVRLRSKTAAAQLDNHDDSRSPPRSRDIAGRTAAPASGQAHAPAGFHARRDSSGGRHRCGALFAMHSHKAFIINWRVNHGKQVVGIPPSRNRKQKIAPRFRVIHPPPLCCEACRYR